MLNNTNTTRYVYVVTVELDTTTTPEKVRNRLMEGIWHMSGCKVLDATEGLPQPEAV